MTHPAAILCVRLLTAANAASGAALVAIDRDATELALSMADEAMEEATVELRRLDAGRPSCVGGWNGRRRRRRTWPDFQDVLLADERAYDEGFDASMRGEVPDHTRGFAPAFRSPPVEIKVDVDTEEPDSTPSSMRWARHRWAWSDVST